VYRLSGTGTVGATLRVYLERYEPATGALDRDVADALDDLIGAADSLAEITVHTGRSAPDVIT
jgi:phosphoglucomutase